MPLPEEYRLFFLNKRLTGCYPYWEEGDYAPIAAVPEALLQVAETVDSAFFSMDIARTEAGSWIIVELGDGQVSGLPEGVEEKAFYRDLYAYTSPPAPLQQAGEG